MTDLITSSTNKEKHEENNEGNEGAWTTHVSHKVEAPSHDEIDGPNAEANNGNGEISKDPILRMLGYRELGLSPS